MKTMVRVEGGTNEALAEVVAHIRDTDVREFLALSYLDTRDEICADLVARYTDRTDTFVAIRDDRAVAFGAMVEHRPNVISAGFFATEDFPAVALPVARFVRRELFPAYRRAGVHRIECMIIDGYESAMLFVRLLGLKIEHEVRGCGKHGESFFSFAWVA
jgi:hypothetical protein